MTCLARFVLPSLLLVIAACGGGDSRRPAPTSTVTATVTATPTASATASRSASATPTATPTVTATATRPALRLPDLHAAPDPVRGGRIVDAEGREVLLRGVNVNALAEYWQYGAFPPTFPLAPDDPDRMAAIGWNAVRLLLSWSRVEPAPGQYDDAYLEEVRGAVRALAARGVYSILDLHQDAWGPTLVARPGETCAPPGELAFGWDGAPGWATLDGGAARCPTLGIRELSPAVIAAFGAFFLDQTDGTGVGIRTRYVAMLAHVAGKLGGEAGVAGYDLMNEPNAFLDADAARLAELYAQAVVAIRAAETAAGSPSRLIFFEPGGAWALLGIGVPPDFARDRDVVYAPHLYQGGLDGQALAPAFDKAREEANTRFGGAPVLTGEWGSGPTRASDPADAYFLEHQRLQDLSHIGATLWTWRESCGDPHKAGDVRAGNVPYVWGEFEVDCTTNAITGVRQDLVDQLTRAYVRAAPGRLIETTFDPTAGTLIARGTEAGAGVELLAFYPSSRLGAPDITAHGFDAIRVEPAPSGDAYIVGIAAGGDWSLSVTLGGDMPSTR